MGLVDESRFEQCLDSIYGVVADPASLPEVVRSVAGLLDATSAAYIRTGPHGDVRSLVTHGFVPSIQGEYVAHYSRIDPARDPIVLGRPGEWMQDDGALDEHYSKFPEYVVDYAPRAGIRWLRGVKLHEERNVGVSLVSFVRPMDARPFDADSMTLMRRLFPHLARMSRLAVDLADVPAASAITEAVADGLACGVCVLDQTMRVVYANKAALRMMAAPGTLTLRHNKVFGSTSTTHGKLLRAVTLATTSPYQASSFAETRCADLVGRIQVRVVPFAGTGALGGAGFARFAFLYLSQGPRPPRADELMQLFELTPSEAELVVLAALGLSPQQCAAHRGVGIATVRTQLSSIYLKAKVDSLPQLISLATSLPGAS